MGLDALGEVHLVIDIPNSLVLVVVSSEEEYVLAEEPSHTKSYL